MDVTDSPGKATRDFFVLGLLLAGANYLLDRADPGWLQLNPTPWLIPSVLVGIRYGFVAGLVTGLITSAGVAIAVARSGSASLPEAFHLHSYHFLALAIAGAVAGEAGTILAKARRELAHETTRLREENVRLRSRLHIVDDTRHQLQQQLALYNAPLCTLDEDLAGIFAHPPEHFSSQLLDVLHRATGITSAAIYKARGDGLHQVAAIHPTSPLKEFLPIAATPLAEKALTSQALASVTNATELTQAQPFLAAFPWMNPQGKACILLIQDMSLESYTLQNLARLEFIISWASALGVLRQDFARHAGKGGHVSHEEFCMLLSEAVRAEQVHGIPSLVMRVQPSAESSHAQRQSVSLPSTAITTPLAGESENAFAVLLPFSGESESLGLTRALSQPNSDACITRHLVSGKRSSEDIWQSLQQKQTA